MIFGMTALTFIHVVISLVAIAAGLAVLADLLRSRWQGGLTAVFLATTIATSVTGFLFPVDRFLPSHAFGIISLVVLGIALAAAYRHHLAGRWRGAYIASAVFALYLNVFVLIVQAFQKVPGLNALAPTQSEAPFLVAQVVALLAFIGAGALAIRRFRPADLAGTAG